MGDGHDGGDGYEVGYGKPPRHTRFKKGQSGNRKGRPKGSKNVVTLLQEVLNQKIDVSEGGHRRRITKREAMMQVTINKALKGDAKAINTIITLWRIGGLLEPVKDEERRGGVLVVPAPLSIEEWEQQQRARMAKEAESKGKKRGD